MGRRFRQDGRVLTLTPAAAVSSDDIIATGDIVVVALGDIAAGAPGSVATEGVFEAPKVTGSAWVVGTALTWDASAGAFGASVTPATGDVVDVAYAAAPAASADATGEIKLANPGTGQ